MPKYFKHIPSFYKGQSRRSSGRYVSRREKNFSLIMLITSVLVSILVMQSGENAKLHEMLYPTPMFSQPDGFIVRAKEIESTPKPVRSFNYDQAFDYVWMRESSQGKNNPTGSAAAKCYIKGKINEIGMGGVAHTVCYENFAEMKAAFNKWLDKNHKGNWTETLCYYNVGLRNNCEYGTGFTEGK